MLNLKTILAALLPLITSSCLAISTSGCAQNTEAGPVTQPARQTTTQAEQGAAARIYTYIINAPATSGLPDQGISVEEPAVRPATEDSAANPVAATTRKTDAGYVQNVYYTVQTGGTASGALAANATANPNSTVTQTPTQKPEATLAVPISFAMPGGYASGQASAAGGSGGGASANLSAQATTDLRTAWLKALSGDTSSLMSFLAGMFGTSPTTQPAATTE